MRYQDINIVGEEYADDNRHWSSQHCINYLPVPAERSGTLTQWQLRQAPGLRPLVRIIQQHASEGVPEVEAGPIRGMREVEGKLFVVAGTTLYQISNSLVAIPYGTIPGVSRVSMAHNQRGLGNELLIATGSAGYVFNTSTLVLQKITDEAYPGAFIAAYIDSYIAQVEPQGRYWFHSDLADALSYNSLDRYEAEGQPDRIVSLYVSHREALLFGRETIEPYVNEPSGDGTAPFQRASNTVIECGCSARYSVAGLDNSVLFLDDKRIVRRLDGYNPVRISTQPIEQALAECTAEQISSAFAFVWEDKGHKVYYLTVPGRFTFGYDVLSRRWHRRLTKGMDRWRLSDLVFWNGMWVGGDYQTGRLYALDWKYGIDGQNPDNEPLELVRNTASGYLSANQNRLRVHAVEVRCRVGSEETVPVDFPDQPEAPTISGIPPESIIGEATTPFQFTLGDGTPPYRVTLRAGTIPPGLSISQQGLRTGTPTRAGTFTYTLRNTDSTGLYADHEVTEQVTVPVFVVGRTGASTYRVMRLAGTTNWNVAPAFPPFSPVFYALGLESGRILAWSQGTSAYSDDHGATWSTPAVQLGGHAGPRSGCERDGVVLITGGSTTSIYRSIDGGATFSEVTGYPDSMYYAVTAETGILMASQAAGKFVFSEDGGLTHEERANTNVSLSGGGAVAYLRHAGAAVLGGYNTSNNAASVAVTDDEGATSTRHDLPEISIVTALGAATIDDEDIWVCGLANGKVYRTKDFSTWTAWSDVLPGAARFVVWDGVRFSVGGDDSSYVLTSEDGVTATRRTCSMTVGVSAAVPTYD